jgi:hypothetical protein
MDPTPLRCLATIFGCTWSVLHLNVPFQVLDEDDSLPLTSGPSRIREMSAFRRKGKWTLVAIIFPEFWIGRAWADRMAASSSVGEMAAMSETDKTPWTLTHAFFANMGGFTIKVSKDQLQDNGLLEEFKDWQSELSQKVSLYSAADIDRAIRQRMLDQITGLWTILGNKYGLLSIDNNVNRQILSSTILHLTAEQIKVLRTDDVLTTLPTQNERYIRDKSKADATAKGITVLLLVWLIISVSYQLKSGGLITPIELTALSYSICAIITYMLWLKKPQDVEVSIDLPFDHTKLNKDVLYKLQNAAGLSYMRERKMIDIRLPIPNDLDYPNAFGMILIGTKRFGFTHVDAGIFLGGSGFGVLHLIAWWRSIFPTAAGHKLWLAAVIIITVSLLLLSGVPILLSLICSRSRWSPKVKLGLHYVIPLFYFSARMFLLFESLYTMSIATIRT